MNKRVIGYQLGIFAAQWVLMVLGFGILIRVVVPLKILGPGVPFGSLLDAGVKALFALILSVVWLFIWDRQVRLYFYKHRR